MKNLWLLLALTFISGMASGQIFRPSASILDPPPSPNVVITGTLIAFVNNAGTPSLPQTVTFTATNLSGNLVFTAGASSEISKDGVTYSSSITYTPSGGAASGTVYVRIKASTTAGSYSESVTSASTGSNNPSIPYTSTVNSGGSSADTMRVAMSLTSQTTPAGFVSFFGDPVTGVRTATNGAGTITISTVSTANWALVTSNAANDADGKTGSTVAGFPDNILRAQMFTYSGSSNNADSSVQTLAKPNFNITGLTPSATYTIQFTSCLDDTRFALTCNNYYWAKGLPTLAYRTPGQLNALGNTSAKQVLTSVQPDATGKVSIYIFTTPGQELGIISGLTIWKN